MSRYSEKKEKKLKCVNKTTLGYSELRDYDEEVFK